MRNTGLAAQIEADILCEQSARADLVKCFMCGRGMIYRGSRFCSDSCRNFYDSGAAGHFQDWLQPPDPFDLPLRDWRIITGPLGVDIGASYGTGMLDTQHVGRWGNHGRPMVMRRGRNGFRVRCAHCTAEFESVGQRCCSAKCETEIGKRGSNRKQRRPKLPYYSVKLNGRGYWQPSAQLRRIGFRSVDCGYEGPEAWAEAARLNDAARAARKSSSTAKKAA
jgi:predicted nucleic acid-binding Zn ribbon protein